MVNKSLREATVMQQDTHPQGLLAAGAKALIVKVYRAHGEAGFQDAW